MFKTTKKISEIQASRFHKFLITYGRKVAQAFGKDLLVKIELDLKGPAYENVMCLIKAERQRGVQKAVLLRDINKRWADQGIIIIGIEEILNKVYSIDQP